jgi:hypothetical protein
LPGRFQAERILLEGAQVVVRRHDGRKLESVAEAPQQHCAEDLFVEAEFLAGFAVENLVHFVVLPFVDDRRRLEVGQIARPNAGPLLIGRLIQLERVVEDLVGQIRQQIRESCPAGCKPNTRRPRKRPGPSIANASFEKLFGRNELVERECRARPNTAWQNS